MTADLLTARQLNRATLERQLLLQRSGMAPLDAVAHLVGMQAQVPLNPYLGLWSRLERFDPHELGRLLGDRAVVRTAVMRSTLHLVTADDCLVLRPMVQPVLDRELYANIDRAARLDGVDLDAVLRLGRTFLTEPRTSAELKAALAEHFPDVDGTALAYACRNRLVLIQAPPRGVWGATSGTAIRLVTAEAWLGRPVSAAPNVEEVVLRYFAAFGPASSADVATWTGLTGTGELVDRIRSQLRPFRDERGRELLDLPDASRPDPDIPAPTRFLPEYDNVLLSHADRTRFLSNERRRHAFADFGAVRGTVLHDGEVVAVWRTEQDGRHEPITLLVGTAGRVAKRAASAIEAEGRRMLRFLHPESDPATHEVRLVPQE